MTRPGGSPDVVAMTTTLVERASSFLESRISRRSFINRSAYAGSAVAIGAGLDLVLKPGTAYGQICTCGNGNCGCGSTCCSGFSEFCCSVNGGYNYCPTNTVMGGWWKADNSSYCGGPRYYMDCNAMCQCDTGCGDGWGFCETGLRRHQLRLRAGRLRLVPHRVLPVPLRPVQPGCRLHRPDRLPGGGLRPALGGGSHLHHHQRRGRRHRRAERGVLDGGATVATPPALRLAR